ncbi:MAG: alpha/beta hydrolase, partial [Pseudomonadota bacterium]
IRDHSSSGDGHPVLVLPGFLAGDSSTRPMRSLLDELGYESSGWGLGRNVQFNDDREQAMSDLVKRLHQDSGGRKVSMVGWSLGGVFARELAKMHPDKVRFVISLGSPITNNRKVSNARHLWAFFNRNSPDEKTPDRRQLDKAPPAPTTSIFTKTDGVVSWRGSVQRPGPMTENIIVPASHFGLGVNPLVMLAIADRLAQNEEDWTPFDRSGWRELFFGSVSQPH